MRFLTLQIIHIFCISLVTGDCGRFVSTPIWDLSTVMGGWKISGYVDSGPPVSGQYYVEIGSNWSGLTNNEKFDIWTYGRIIDSNFNYMNFDDWRTAKIEDANRPGQLLNFRYGEEAISNQTILFSDRNFILWIDCSLQATGNERVVAYMGYSTVLVEKPSNYKDQFKSILRQYGLDVDTNYVDIPQFPPSPVSPTSEISLSNDEYD